MVLTAFLILVVAAIAGHALFARLCKLGGPASFLRELGILLAVAVAAVWPYGLRVLGLWPFAGGWATVWLFGFLVGLTVVSIKMNRSHQPQG